jgi:ribosomal protein S18 acetylase RimI-like enzyme
MMVRPTDPRIRSAHVTDADQIAEVHVAASKAAYQGLLPAGRPSVSVDFRRRQWNDALRDGDPRTWTLVADDGTQICGFAKAGPSRDADAAADTGELYMLYLLPGYWRRGLGNLIQRRILLDMAEAGFRAATLWVLETNIRARRFYESTGWRPDGQVKTEPYGENFTVQEVRYRRHL